MSSGNKPGDIVPGPPALLPSADTNLNDNHGNGVTLIPLIPSHAPLLYPHVGGPGKDNLYKYMTDGPFLSLDTLTIFVNFLISSPTIFPYTIFVSSASSNQPGEALGIVCLLNIVPEHRTVEIGYVLFSKSVAAYGTGNRGELFIDEIWFAKGRRRDSAWFSCLDDEWFGRELGERKSGVKEALEKWLGKENFDVEGKQVRKLEDIRDGKEW